MTRAYVADAYAEAVRRPASVENILCSMKHIADIFLSPPLRPGSRKVFTDISQLTEDWRLKLAPFGFLAKAHTIIVRPSQCDISLRNELDIA